MEEELAAVKNLLAVLNHEAQPLLTADLLVRRIDPHVITSQEIDSLEAARDAFRISAGHPDSPEHALAVAELALCELWHGERAGPEQAHNAVTLGRARQIGARGLEDDLRKWLALLTALLAAVAIGLISSAAATAGPYCGIRWGRCRRRMASGGPLPSSESGPAAISASTASCWTPRGSSRLPGRVRDGRAVRWFRSHHPVRGRARLQITLLAPAHDADYNPTFRPSNRNEVVNVAGWNTFRQVVFGATFQGQTTLGLGLRARLPFRVFTLDGPCSGSRIVIDVAHGW